MLPLETPTRYRNTYSTYTVNDSTRITDASYRITAPDGTEVVPRTAFRSSGSSFNWSGESPDGSLLPSGEYTVHARFVDSGGNATTSSDLRITLDDRAPVRVAVVEDPDRPGVFRATATQTPGVDVDDVTFSFDGGAGSSGVHDRVAGTWTASVDWSDVREGPRFVRVRALLTGGQYLPDLVTVAIPDTLPPRVEPSDPTRLTLESRTAWERGTVGFVVDDGSGLRPGSLTVTDSAGRVVATLSTNDGTGSTSWSGVDDDGRMLPPGAYTVSGTFVDVAGNAAPRASQQVVLDGTIPGALTSPAPGATWSGDMPLAFVPSVGAGASVVSASVQVFGSMPASTGSVSFDAPAATGPWRTTFPVYELEAGPHQAQLVVRWKDADGGEHVFAEDRTDLVAAPGTIAVTLLEPEPRPTRLDEIGLRVRVVHPAAKDVDVSVDWGDGSTPTRAVVASAASPSFAHTYRSAGTFTVTVTASAGALRTIRTATYSPVLPPTAPVDVTSRLGHRAITVAWLPPPGSVRGYDVALQVDGEPWVVRPTDVQARSTVFDGLANGRTYRVMVRARNEAGVGPYSPPRTHRPDAVPVTPTRVAAKASKRSAVVRWAAGRADAEHGRVSAYVVEVRRPGSKRWTRVRAVGPATRSTTVRRLRVGQRYRFRVVAQNAVGRSRVSAAVTIRTGGRRR